MTSLPSLHPEAWQIARANRILAHEGVLDAFGHVSLRDPGNAGHYLLSRSRSPELVAPEDVLAFDLTSAPVRPTEQTLYSERVIHGAIYAARPDVQAVCHLHAPALMPFCVAGIPPAPVTHLGATAGAVLPFWSAQENFGDTDLLVSTAEQSHSLAAALGPHWVVLLRNHGAVVAGRNLREMVFRAIYLCRNAEIHRASLALGPLKVLTPGEVEAAGACNLRPAVLQRAWDYWCGRLAHADADVTPPAQEQAA